MYETMLYIHPVLLAEDWEPVMCHWVCAREAEEVLRSQKQHRESSRLLIYSVRLCDDFLV